MRDFEAEDYLFLLVPLTPLLSVGLVDIRHRFGRHSPEERAKLKLLGPHIQQVYHRLAAQGQVSASPSVVRRLEQAFVNPAGHVTKWTDEARPLLEQYGILVAGDNLSPGVKEWFFAQRRSLESPAEVTLGTTPLCLKRAGADLSIYLARRPGLRTYQLILQEKESSLETSGLLPEYGITKRESEVLYWLAQGKANAKIATILGMSTGTVGRHLENAFPKLGVENRYAAGLMVNQALADRAMASVPR
jgi:DNA-binding CsgD family transcriptional regulator